MTNCSNQGRLLIVDDEKSCRLTIAEYFSERGYDTVGAESGEAALEVVKSRTVDVATVDLFMPGISGMELIAKLKQIDPLIEIIMITGERSVEFAVQAMREGAYDYVPKPVQLPDLEMCITRATEKAILARENRQFRETQRRHHVHLTSGIVAQSDAMREVLQTAEGVCNTNAPVLIEGETGVGKEVLAEFIHAGSQRKDVPMTTLDCGSLSVNLIEEELFGHEKGTFTGATEPRPGMLEMADRGTLFLDEIGEMPIEAQTRLLRALEKGTLRRLGGRVEKRVDVRILAATNRDLRRSIEKGTFRQDLYYRLLVFRLVIPPLRERKADILPLAYSLLHNHGTTDEGLGLSDEAQDALCAYSWPGNVRELIHTIERAILYAELANSSLILPEHLTLPTVHDAVTDDGAISLKEADNRHIAKVLDTVGGNRKQAANILGLSERQLYRRLST